MPVFPADYSDFTPNSDVTDFVLASDINELQDAIKRIETHLGLNAQGSQATVAARLANIKDEVDVVRVQQEVDGGTITLGTAFTDVRVLDFTRPAGWTTFDMYAWGFVVVETGGDSAVHYARVVIQNVAGAEKSMGTSLTPKTLLATHQRSALNLATCEVKIQAKRDAGGAATAYTGIIHAIARRTG